MENQTVDNFLSFSIHKFIYRNSPMPGITRRRMEESPI